MQALNEASKHTGPSRNEDSGVRALPSTELPLPRNLGRLLLLKQLARGGMGDVFLAASGAIDGAERPCVVKTIRRDHADDESFLARFLDEARIQSQLQHSGVVQILEAATDDAGKPYVVVEYVEGRNLGEVRLRSAQLGARLSWQDAVAIAVGIGEGLAYIHECRDANGKSLDIVHRDLSPQNVMVSYSGEVKLIDFGTARAENRRCRTVAGIVFAKPGYVAPEVANNTPGGVPADIYAFGVMLWELVAGRRFLYGDPAQHLAAVGEGKRCPARLEKITECPAELDRIIGKLTATLIEQRYRTARDAVADLLWLLANVSGRASAEPTTQGSIHRLMTQLYPGEPQKARTEFSELMAQAKSQQIDSAQRSPVQLAEPSETELLAGTRYRLARELGRGATSIVYEAFHVDLDQVFALKLLSPEACYEVEAKERLRAEAKLVFGFEHPNLVKVHDFGFCANGRPFFVMERLLGETLDKYVERKRGMDFREACQLGIQACSALEAAHERGLIHRDIKLQNLFRTEAGVLKLLDFGVAKSKSEVVDVEDGALRVMGTPETMSPEQARGHSGDARSDIYSLGAVLYELVTGHPTHTAESLAAMLRAKCCKEARPIRERAPQRGLPRTLEKVLAQALERHPEMRFASAGAFRAALVEVLSASRRRSGQKRVLVWAAATAFMASAGYAVLANVAPELILRQTAQAHVQLIRARTELSDTSRRVWGEAQRLGPAASAIQPRPLAGQQALNVATLPMVRLAPVESFTVARVRPAPPAPPALSADVQNPKSVASVEQPPAAIEYVVSDGIKVVHATIQRGNVVAALNAARKLGKHHPDDGRVLQLWSETAVKAKGWGEALRVAQRWAATDPGSTAELHLIRMLRSTGHGAEADRRSAALSNVQEGSARAGHELPPTSPMAAN